MSPGEGATHGFSGRSPGQSNGSFLTTIGRRTGLPREIEIWFTQRDGRYYVISEHYQRGQWVQDILTDRRVRRQARDASFAGQARPIEVAREPSLARGIQHCSRRKCGWDEGLIVELTPDPPT